ncbi:MAG: hypothetical protein H0W09_01385 [Solirubrobacterales bacterium]|nr:hypothetical protein [Solirubrobacterales bacterium]
MDTAPRDEWRVEVELDYSESGMELGRRLGALDLDDELRERLGRRVIVTRDGPRIFAYSSDESAISEARAVIERVISEDALEARIRLTRWHPVEEAWEDASLPMPTSEGQLDAERRRNEADEREELERTGEYDWQVALHHVGGFRDAHELAAGLREQGLDAEAHWAHVLVGALTEQRAEDLVERVRGLAPEGAQVEIRANLDDVKRPTFFFFPGVAP